MVHMRKQTGGSRVGVWSTVPVPVALVLAFAVVTAGCTVGVHAADGDAGNGRKPGSSSATIRDSGDPVAVVDGDAPDALSVAASRALFEAAPVVVVAGTDDRPGIDDGAAQAIRLGVPLLLVAPPAAVSQTAVTGHMAGAGTDPVPVGLAAEVARLGAHTVLATGVAAEGRLGKLPDVRVVTDGRKLPGASPAGTASDVVVLVRTGTDGTAAAAAAASAKAARARVIPVTGPDLRGDSTVIAALAERRPRRVLAVGSGFGSLDRLRDRLSVAETGIQLPGGGQVLFPGHRLVALYGHPGSPELGVLGKQDVAASIARAKQLAADYAPLSSVAVVPTFEIIATTAQGEPGEDGDYSGESTVASLRPWVEQASAAGLYVVLDLQPGRAHFLDQAKLYADLLRLPNVGLALDPEWRLGPHQKPLGQIGAVDAEEINSVITWLADLTAAAKLPQKLLLLHQFQLSSIRAEQNIDLGRDQIQVLIHMDGQGSPALKDSTWLAVTRTAPEGVPFGWKNFYHEDKPMLSAADTMTRKPTPMMISYQ